MNDNQKPITSTQIPYAKNVILEALASAITYWDAKHEVARKQYEIDKKKRDEEIKAYKDAEEDKQRKRDEWDRTHWFGTNPYLEMRFTLLTDNPYFQTPFSFYEVENAKSNLYYMRVTQKAIDSSIVDKTIMLSHEDATRIFCFNSP